MAIALHEIRFDEILGVEEYLSRIPSPIKRQMTADLLASIGSLFDPIRVRIGSDAPIPVLRISTSGAPDAEAGDGRIMLSAGLIDYCFSIQDEGTVAALNIDTSFFPTLVPTAAMTWFYAHEAFHLVRGHNKLLEVVGDNVETRKATERDADLCAVAALYRKFQQHCGHALPDIELRKLVVYSVFWALRRIADHPQQTHSRPDERIMHATLKVGLFLADPTIPVDVEAKRQETRDRTTTMISTLAECEKSFRRVNPDHKSDFNLRTRAEEGIDRSTVQVWDRIRLAHSILMGQRDGILDLPSN